MHPKDSLEDFKKFFTEIGKIWNNGNVGDGLRQHGVNASKLLIKYLPLGGGPGFAAATALEKLQVTKWINILATLIDFVSGKGNIMNFFNALKELVGDIFELIKNVVTEIIKDPGQIINPVKDAFMGVANTIEEALNPAFAAQEQAKRRDAQLLQGEQILAEEVIQDSIDEAIDTFDENKPDNIDQALRYMYQLGITQDKLPRYAPNIDFADDEADRSVLDDRPTLNEDRRKEIDGKIYVFQQKRYMDPDKVAKSKEYESQVLRMNYADHAYIVPWLLYLRDNWDKKPDWMKDVPQLPSWDPQRFFELAQAPWGSGKDEYDAAMNPWYAAMGKAIKDNDKVIADKIEEKRKVKNDKWAADEAARAKKSFEDNLTRPQRYREAVYAFAKKTNQPLPEGSLPEDIYSDEFNEKMPVMTTNDEIYVRSVVDGMYTGAGGPFPATQEQLEKDWENAVASHNTEGYLNKLGVLLGNMQAGHNTRTEPKYAKDTDDFGNDISSSKRSFQKGEEQSSFMAKKIIELIKKKPNGVQKLKEFAATLPPGPMNDNYQREWVLANTDPEAFKKANSAPSRAPIPEPPAPPEAPAAPAAPAAPQGAAEPEDEDEDMFPNMFGGGMTGGAKHPFQHLESQGVRAGKRPRLQLLDPYFFEGTL